MENFIIHHGDNRAVLKAMEDNSIDSIVTDPPYELGFMGKSWDASGIAFNIKVWAECLRVLKPGGHLLAFSGSRTYHRMAVAIEDAGFEIRDQIMWIYGSGFPKSLDVSKAIDKNAGVEREIISEIPAYGIGGNGILGGHSEGATAKLTYPFTAEAKQWQGWGTALKPAHEPIVVARKPLIGTVAANVLTYGTGGLNIDGARIGNEGGTARDGKANQPNDSGWENMRGHGIQELNKGRWPANVIHDGIESEWSKFFYCAKASKGDRNEGLDLEQFPLRHYTTANKMGGETDTMLTGSGNPRDSRKQNYHPTVKPTDLMRYLCRLITPPGGIVLDPFMGSGSTGKAAIYENFKFIGIEMLDDYISIAEARIKFASEEMKRRLL
jgi:site-specific DNA-methyltransferase (adenine-specific)